MIPNAIGDTDSHVIQSDVEAHTDIRFGLLGSRRTAVEPKEHNALQGEGEYFTL